MLVAGWIPGLSSCPYSVKDLRAVLQVEAKALEIVIPVGVLDDDFHLGIGCLCGAYNQVAPGLVHQFKPVLSPASVPLCLDFDVFLAAGEEEVVQQEFVKMARSVLRHLLHPGPVLGIGVAECLKVIGLAYGIGDAACHFNALLLKESFGFIKRGVIHQQHVAVSLKIDLVHIQLAGDGFPSGLQPLGVLHLVHLEGPDIDRYFEVLVPCRRRNDRTKRQNGAQKYVQYLSHYG